jgi:cystathionine beta-lyase
MPADGLSSAEGLSRAEELNGAEDLNGADALTATELRDRGSLKWTAFPADIAAWVAESDLGTAPAVTAALHTAIDAGELGYLSPARRRTLAQSCAQWHLDRYGWQVPPDRIHPVADVLEALRVAVEHFSRPGSPLILPTPGYMPFLTVPRLWGREVLSVPMARDGGRDVLDLDGIGRAFEAGGHLLVLTNPHNPTGRVLSRAELLDVADVVGRHGGRVFADEIHAPLVLPGARHVPYAAVSDVAAGHTITATSASKGWNLAGLKCAQVLLSNDADAATWAPIDHAATHGASTLGVIANAAAYREGGPWLDRLVEYLDGNRRALADALAEHAPMIGYDPPEGTYLAWLDLRRALAALPDAVGPRAVPDGLSRWLLDRTGIAVVDGAACGAAGRGFVRLNLAMPRPMVTEAARRLGGCLGPTG